MSINLDFSSIPKREPLSAGVYTLTIENVEETVTKETGNQMLKATFVVNDTENQKLFDNFVLIPKVLWKLKEFLGALGYNTDEIVDLNLEDLVGQMIVAEVVQDTYNGNPTNRIKKYMPA